MRSAHLALLVVVAGCIEGPGPEQSITNNLTVCPVPIGADNEPARQFRVALTPESVDLLFARGQPTTVIAELDVWRDDSLCNVAPQANPNLIVGVMMQSMQSETQVQGSFRYRDDRVFERFELPVLQDCPREQPCEDLISVDVSREDSNAPWDIGLRVRALTETLLAPDDVDRVTIEIEWAEL